MAAYFVVPMIIDARLQNLCSELCFSRYRVRNV